MWRPAQRRRAFREEEVAAGGECGRAKRLLVVDTVAAVWPV